MSIRNTLGIVELAENFMVLAAQVASIQEAVIQLENRTKLFVKDNKCRTVN